MPDIPQAAVDAVAELHHRMHCLARCDGTPHELDVAAARQLLEAAEQAWPHTPATRDPASTTSAQLTLGPRKVFTSRDRRRQPLRPAPFGFGKPTGATDA